MALTRGVLGRAVGMGGENDRNDVIGMKHLMQALGLYQPPPEGLHDAIDADFDRAIRDFQEKNGLKVDGLMLPGGETERNLIAHATGEGFERVDPADVAIGDGVGFGGANDTADVTAIKRAMGALGRYPYDRTRPPPPYIDGKLVEGIEAFQRENGLFDDGLIAPDGETLPALRDALATRQQTDGAGDGAGQRGEYQVAFAPAIAGAAVAPFVVPALGLAIALGAGQAVIDAAKHKRPPGPAKRETAPDPASFLTPFSRHEIDKEGGTLSYPSEPPFKNTNPPPSPAEPPFKDTHLPPSQPQPIQLPSHTEFPIPDDPGVLIEVYPNQSDEFDVPQIFESSRGSPKTEAYNTKHVLVTNAASEEEQLPIDHTHGAYTGLGVKLKELWMRNSKTGGRKGSSRPDIVFENRVTKRRLFINTTDTGADGVSLTKRELDAAIRIIMNGKSGDILMTSPKPSEGYEIDFEALKEFIRPLLHEISKPIPKIDPRSKKAPENLIKRWFPPKK